MTKVAEFWKLPDALANATRVTFIRRIATGGMWQWECALRKVDQELIAFCIYDAED